MAGHVDVQVKSCIEWLQGANGEKWGTVEQGS